jgi:hypothetical protein
LDAAEGGVLPVLDLDPAIVPAAAAAALAVVPPGPSGRRDETAARDRDGFGALMHGAAGIHPDARGAWAANASIVKAAPEDSPD